MRANIYLEVIMEISNITLQDILSKYSKTLTPLLSSDSSRLSMNKLQLQILDKAIQEGLNSDEPEKELIEIANYINTLVLLNKIKLIR